MVEYDITNSFSISKGWSIVDRLPEIRNPTLIINGRFDIAQDDTVRPWVEGIPAARWETFDNSSHTPMWEEREKYMQVVGNFLDA